MLLTRYVHHLVLNVLFAVEPSDDETASHALADDTEESNAQIAAEMYDSDATIIDDDIYGGDTEDDIYGGDTEVDEEKPSDIGEAGTAMCPAPND